MIDLSGQRVLVTGGSRGIGAACCRLFARAGASVWVHFAAREDAARAVLAEISEPGGVSEPGEPAEPGTADRAEPGEPGGTSHRSSRADLSKRSEVDALFESIAREWGGLDCLVNNAGIWGRNDIRALDDRKFEETLELNVKGVFWAARAAIPLLSESGNASIVNISSTAGQRGEAFHSPYAASKGAVIAVTKSWAVELAPGIRVNSVAPGWVDTDMSAGAYEGEGRAEIERSIPLGRVATAEEIAGAVLFLASPLARHVTGEVLNVNGGSVLCG